MNNLSSMEHSAAPDDGAKRLSWRKLWKGITHEFSLEGIHLRLCLTRMVLAPLPIYQGSRLRALALRAAGFSIGSGTVFYGMPTITGNRNLYSRLVIGRSCLINVGCFLDAQDDITIGDRVSIGHQVMILTTTHKVGPEERRADFAGITAPVRIEAGVWIGARSVILPGVTIGRGSIIGAGTIVRKDVPANMLVKDARRVPIDEWLASKHPS